MSFVLRLKVHGISCNLCECHILWASAGFLFWVVGGGGAFGFSFPQWFICDSYIQATLHIWPVFQFKSKGLNFTV